MDRIIKTLDILTALGQLTLTLVLLRVAWELVQLFGWTGMAQ